MIFYVPLVLFFVTPHFLEGMDLESQLSAYAYEEDRIPQESYFLQVLENTRVEIANTEPTPLQARVNPPDTEIPYWLIDQLVARKKNEVAIIPEDFYQFDVSGEIRFYCVIRGCTSFFTDKDSLAHHVLSHSKKQQAFCPYTFCSKPIFKAQRTLLKHVLRHLNHRPYRCSKCKRGFVQSADLAYHKENRHEI